MRVPAGNTMSGWVSLSTRAGPSPFDGSNVRHLSSSPAQPSGHASVTVAVPSALHDVSSLLVQLRGVDATQNGKQPSVGSQPAGHSIGTNDFPSGLQTSAVSPSQAPSSLGAQFTSMQAFGTPLISPVVSQNPKSGLLHCPSGHVAAGFGFVQLERRIDETTTRVRMLRMEPPLGTATQMLRLFFVVGFRQKPRALAHRVSWR